MEVAGAPASPRQVRPAGRWAATLAAAGALFLLGAIPANAATPLALEISRAPFRITVSSAGKVVVAEDVARLRFQVAPTDNVYALTKVIATSEHGQHIELNVRHILYVQVELT